MHGPDEGALARFCFTGKLSRWAAKSILNSELIVGLTHGGVSFRGLVLWVLPVRAIAPQFTSVISANLSRRRFEQYRHTLTILERESDLFLDCSRSGLGEDLYLVLTDAH